MFTKGANQMLRIGQGVKAIYVKVSQYITIRKLYSSCKFIKYEHDKGIKDLYGLLSMYINMHIIYLCVSM